MRVTFCRPPLTLQRKGGHARLRRAIAFVAAILLLAAMAREDASAQTAVDLQLVLAVDVSGSVNPQRFELQKMGYVAAFQNKRVLSAILSGGKQSIAVTMMQWSGPFLQSQVVPWTLLKDESSVKGFAGAIEVGAPHDVRRRHFDLGRDRQCRDAVPAGRVQGRAPGDRRIG